MNNLERRCNLSAIRLGKSCFVLRRMARDLEIL